MANEAANVDQPFVLQKLGWRDWLGEVIIALAITVGMALLWMLENVRNVFFRLLDRLNLKPRSHRASAFPPGRPRKLKTSENLSKTE